MSQLTCDRCKKECPEVFRIGSYNTPIRDYLLTPQNIPLTMYSLCSYCFGSFKQWTVVLDHKPNRKS